MKRTLYKVAVPVTEDTEDATVELLQSVFERIPCVETDLESNTTHVSVFLDRAPARAKLQGLLPRFSVRKLPPQNWAESWKRHFKPIEIGSKLLIKPSWSRKKASRGQRVIVLDPGLSFGTGRHPTTRFCLEQIVAFRDGCQTQSFLDVGTGSGILAIAAAKLGYAPVRGFDFDPSAVRIARANATRNGVARSLRFAVKNATDEKPSRQYHLICANLLADLLLSQRDRLIGWLKPAGRIVLAGILKTEFDNIRLVYERAGLCLIAQAVENEWRSGAFVRAVRNEVI